MKEKRIKKLTKAFHKVAPAHNLHTRDKILFVLTHIPGLLVGLILLLNPKNRQIILGSTVLTFTVVSTIYHSLQCWSGADHKASIVASWFDTAMGLILAILFVSLYVLPPYVWVIGAAVLSLQLVSWALSQNLKAYTIIHSLWHVFLAGWVLLAAYTLVRVRWKALEPIRS